MCIIMQILKVSNFLGKYGIIKFFWVYGATSIEKIPKISASGRNFLDPLPPSSKKGPTDENVGILYLIVIIKFGFFRVSNPSPPLFHQRAEPHRFYQLRWPLRIVSSSPTHFHSEKIGLIRVTYDLPCQC